MPKSSKTIKEIVQNIQKQIGNKTADFPLLINKSTKETTYAIPFIFNHNGKRREFLHPIKFCPFSGEALA